MGSLQWLYEIRLLENGLGVPRFRITAERRIMLGRDETKFEAFVRAHTLLNIITGRPLNLLSKENVDLGMKI